MKRLWNIYESVYSLENLRIAHKMARKDKSLYRDVKMVDSNPDLYLKEIQVLLKEKRYRINKNDYSIQIIWDKTKERELRKLKYYPHRIIQRAIMLKLEDMFNKHLCYHTCASLVWRWWIRISQLMNKYLKDKEWTKYCLKIDIKKYYPNINHKILKQQLRKKIKDPDVLRLLDMTIDSFPWKKWLPIWSYLSQYLANFYLSRFDHWLKEELHLKYVLRYMDDIVILWPKPSTLRVVYRRMKKYLSWHLWLQIKWNRQIFPTATRWIDYIWYRYFWNYTLLRKDTAKKLKKRFRQISNAYKKWYEMNFKLRCSINSYSWRLLHCDSYRLSHKYITPLVNNMCNYYSKHINDEQNKANKYKNKLLKKLD